MPRLFTAIEIPESIRRKIACLDLPAADVARITAPEDLHITLHFIGEVADSICDAAQVRLRSVITPAFEQKLRSAGVFANRGRPEILWVGVDQSAELLTLREAIGDVLTSLEIKLDTREFNPHATVARLKRPAPSVAAEFRQRNSPWYSWFTARSFALYSVAPGGQDPHYRVVEEYSLRAL